jgi:hypothetical protein
MSPMKTNLMTFLVNAGLALMILFFVALAVIGIASLFAPCPTP